MRKTNKTMILILCCLLIFISLSCQLINMMTDPGSMRVESVDVTQKNVGTFTASVAIPFHDNDDVLTCYVVMKDGQQKTVYQKPVKANDKSSILQFDFEMTEPGTHKMYCSDSEYKGTAKTEFVVAGIPTPEIVNSITPEDRINQPTSMDTALSSSTETPKPDGPIIIKGSGKWTLYTSEGNGCSASVNSVLTIQQDGRASLNASGNGFVDHVNCTKSASTEGWIIEGMADLDNETVVFTKCNMGNFKGVGNISYKDGKLGGTVSCFWNKGEANGKKAMELKLLN